MGQTDALAAGRGVGPGSRSTGRDDSRAFRRSCRSPASSCPAARRLRPNHPLAGHRHGPAARVLAVPAAAACHSRVFDTGPRRPSHTRPATRGSPAAQRWRRPGAARHRHLPANGDRPRIGRGHARRHHAKRPANAAVVLEATEMTLPILGCAFGKETPRIAGHAKAVRIRRHRSRRSPWRGRSWHAGHCAVKTSAPAPALTLLPRSDRNTRRTSCRWGQT